MFGESIRILGKHPNLKELELEFPPVFDQGVDWMGLLPAAERLSTLRLTYLDANESKLNTLLPSMFNLKDLKLLLMSGICDILLGAISRLPSLKTLIIRCNSRLTLDSKKCFIRIANGPAGLSLFFCKIWLQADGKQVRKALIQCFKDHVEPLIRSRGGVTRELRLVGL
mmetsp:Transcript_20029/g.49686  ORF Transcript_20029/g.49686 Transcript_20029/m.49686 type:complete len:169 (-) Transcript_20029:115-621(-)